MMRRALIALFAAAILAAVCVPAIASAAKPKPVKSTVIVLTANGTGADGAFAGYAKSRKSACLSNRKVRLFGRKTLLDKGTTAENGSWALHLTFAEYGSYSKFTVKMSTSRLKSGRKCAGDTDVVTPSPAP